MQDDGVANTLPSRIAQCALRHYDTKLTRGKPKDKTEWTVYAAIVALRNDELWVLSAATGTKCTAHRSNGNILHDCHAEVLARRGLLRLFWMEIQRKPKPKSEKTGEGTVNDLLEMTSDKKFQLRSDISLHLYISDSPCGDAAIYGTHSGQLFTGAKVVVSADTGITTNQCGGSHQLLHGAPVAREDIQLLAKLRSKSGRSNIPSHLRSTSMSCSDKIVKWCVLGLQGSLLSKFMTPVGLSSVIVSRDPRDANNQKDSLLRAIPQRVQGVWKHVLDSGAENDSTVRGSKSSPGSVPEAFIVNEGFPSTKSVIVPTLGQQLPSNPEDPPLTKKQKREVGQTAKVSPCGFAINWQLGDTNTSEIVVGARGICQGRKPKTNEDFKLLSSRLSRQGLLRVAKDLLSTSERSYQALKSSFCDKELRELKTLVFEGGPLRGWLQEKSDFVID